MSRRTFLIISGGAAAAIGVSQLVSRSGADLVRPIEQEGEGVPLGEKYVATSCLNCPGRCGIVVRTVEGKAVKIAGNPLSRVSDGKTCPRAQAGLQVLYDTGRVHTPLMRTNPAKGKDVDPRWVEISWEQALTQVSRRMKQLRDQGEPQKLAMVHGLNSRSSEDLILRFAEAYGTPNVASSEALESEAEKFGRWMADGQYSELAYDLGQANYVLAFGADLLESATPLSAVLHSWGEMRRGRPNRGKAVVVDPRYSVTAAEADEWVPIKPGTDAALALAVANVIIAEDLYNAGFVQGQCFDFDRFAQLVLDNYGPGQVAEITGVESERIRSIAREFAQTRPAIAWIGRGAAGWPNGTYASYAVHCLNALVGSLDIPGGVFYASPPHYLQMPAVVKDGVAEKGLASPRIDLG
jgi:anaerobic selenocysteine-containing dehydrogenase